MTRNDMLGVITDGTSVTIEDYYSFNNYTPDTDSDLGTGNDYEYISGGVDSDGYIDVTFRRKLNTKDEYDTVIVPDKRTKICFAYLKNDAEWHEHSDYRNH